MTSSRRTLDDTALERLLAGRTVDGRPELEPVMTLVCAVRGLELDPPAPRGHLAALLAAGFDPAGAPAAADDVPVWAPPTPARGRFLRHPVARVAGLSLVAKVLLGGGVAVAGVTSAAGAGVLPDPVQDGVSTVVEAVTPFEVPRADRPDTAPAVTPGTDAGDPGRPSVPAGPPSSRPAAPAERPGTPGRTALPEQAPDSPGRPTEAPGRTARPEQAPTPKPGPEGTTSAPPREKPEPPRAGEPAAPAQQAPGRTSQQAPGQPASQAPGLQEETTTPTPAPDGDTAAPVGDTAAAGEPTDGKDRTATASRR